MLEKLSVLERLEQMLQRWEDAKRITTLEQKKEMSVLLGGSKSGMVLETLAESSTGIRWENARERMGDLSQKETIRPGESEEIRWVRGLEENNKVETLNHRLEMHVFDGWNL